MSVSMHSVFVYGTLKKDFPNFSVNNGTCLCQAARTKNAYPLYLVGERYVPWLVLDEGHGNPVQGEVYAVSDSELAEMDVLEQVSEVHGYQRVEREVVCTEAGETIKAYLYGKTVNQLSGEKIQHTLKDEYTLAHSALYRPRKT